MLVTVICEYCGHTLEYERRGPTRRICFSPACAKERARDQIFRGRAHRKAPFERFGRRDIFERDNWICYLCGIPTDREVEPHESLAPSIDHVHSGRGGQTWDLCRTAHMVCNTRKGTLHYDLTLSALVVAPGSTFQTEDSYPAIPFEIGAWVRCPDCGRRVLKSPSGILCVGPLIHGSTGAPCPDPNWIDHAAEGNARRLQRL